MYRTTIAPRPRGLLAILDGKFSLLAISAFVLLSGTFALATALIPEPKDEVRPMSPVVAAAEADLRGTLDERVHLHLKRLASR